MRALCFRLEGKCFVYISKRANERAKQAPTSPTFPGTVHGLHLLLLSPPPPPPPHDKSTQVCIFSQQGFN